MNSKGSKRLPREYFSESSHFERTNSCKESTKANKTDEKPGKREEVCSKKQKQDIRGQNYPKHFKLAVSAGLLNGLN